MMPESNNRFSSVPKPAKRGGKTFRSDGFSLLELTAVVVVIGILASVTTSWASSFLKTAKIDATKSKLNSAAAGCLQGIREGEDPSQPIGSNLLSDDLISGDGYKISESMRTCSSLMVEAIGDNPDPYFFPMGFTISGGRLTKFAFPFSEDSQASCKAWAGSNCKAGEELLDLIAHNKAVEEAKTKCNDEFYTWKDGNPPLVLEGDGKGYRWNPEADSACKRVPPANKSETCTPSGCNLETWVFEGTIVAGKDGYDKALQDKYDKECFEKLKKIEADGTRRDGPVTFKECGPYKKHWFFDGVNYATEADRNKEWCKFEKEYHQESRTTGKTDIPQCNEKTFYYCLGDDKGTEDLMKDCIGKNKEASCQNAINEALANNHEGEFIADQGGPGACSTVIWMCEGKTFSSEASYKETGCATKVCILPMAACKYPQYHTHESCIDWARCEGLVK